jgi:hypothetical protein
MCSMRSILDMLTYCFTLYPISRVYAHVYTSYACMHTYIHTLFMFMFIFIYNSIHVWRYSEISPLDLVGSRSSPQAPSGSKSLEKEQATQRKSNTKRGCCTFGSTSGGWNKQASYLELCKGKLALLIRGLKAFSCLSLKSTPVKALMAPSDQ